MSHLPRLSSATQPHDEQTPDEDEQVFERFFKHLSSSSRLEEDEVGRDTDFSAAEDELFLQQAHDVTDVQVPEDVTEPVISRHSEQSQLSEEDS